MDIFYHDRCGDRSGGWVPAGMSSNNVPVQGTTKLYTIAPMGARGSEKINPARDVPMPTTRIRLRAVHFGAINIVRSRWTRTPYR